jgi:Activator of Hsp90 ATPase homolog 1-like protein
MHTSQDQSFTTAFEVERPPQEAFEAITNVRGWWSQEVEGVTDQVGGEFDYHYQDVHRCRVRVTELVPGRKVAWRVLDNYFNFIDNQAEWKDTEVIFEISAKDGGAQVNVTHRGLVPQYECYDVCSNAWGGYLDGSLRDLINTGQGQPNPKEDGHAPTHQDAATMLRGQHSPGATHPADSADQSG